MTPLERNRLGDQIAEEQVVYWNAQGLTYPAMMRAIGHHPPGIRFTDRELVKEVVKLTWLRLKAA